ncbi:hypothetical protein EsDP_00004244 [Epichloe bromicola]|uniref:AA1-like domain-containing protein n=1 Tax=Epichloe bromicola TaxID=79588 RepID=A0ABQ0CRA2_9HYPO
MKPTTALVYGLAAAAANAAPTDESLRTEKTTITNLFVRQYVTGGDKRIDSVTFKLSGDNATDLDCAAQSPEFPNPQRPTTCGTSKYRFTLRPGTDGSEFSLRLYHELAPAVGLWGDKNCPLYCHAGGRGPSDSACTQVGDFNIVLGSSGPPKDP